MTLTRIFTFAIADEAAQEFAVSTFNGFKETCKKVCSSPPSSLPPLRGL